MHESPLQPLRIALLVALAGVLGVGAIGMNELRRGDASDPVARLTPSQALAAEVAPPAGALVAGRAEPVAPPQAVDPVPVVVERRGGVACAAPHRVVQVPRDLPVRATPKGARIGTLPSSSQYLGTNTLAWVQAVTADGAWGKVTVPWGRTVNQAGWIPLAGLASGTTRTMLVGDLSDRRLRVYRGCTQVFEAPAAIGASASPSPKGRFWVTDRVTVPADQPYFGTFAFGLSTIQPSPPKGWTGGNQMAVHGTNAPGSIGTAASAGCLRVSEQTLAALKPLLRLGTPVVIQA